MLAPVVVVVECFAVYAYNLCGNLSVLGPKVHCWAGHLYNIAGSYDHLLRVRSNS